MNDNIAKAWVEANAKMGRTKAQALRELNGQTGRRYDWSRLAEWVDGKLPVPIAARREMLRLVVETALADANAGYKDIPETVDYLVGRLW